MELNYTEKQQEVINSTNYLNLISSVRRGGKTVTEKRIIYDLLTQGHSVLFIAPNSNMYRKIIFDDDFYIFERKIIHGHSTLIHKSTGGSVRFISSDQYKNMVDIWFFQYAIIDEAAFIDNLEEIMSDLTRRIWIRVYLFSTPKKYSHFNRMMLGGGYHNISRFYYFANPFIDPDQFNSMKDSVGWFNFSQEIQGVLIEQEMLNLLRVILDKTEKYEPDGDWISELAVWNWLAPTHVENYHDYIDECLKDKLIDVKLSDSFNLKSYRITQKGRSFLKKYGR